MNFNTMSVNPKDKDKDKDKDKTDKDKEKDQQATITMIEDVDTFIGNHTYIDPSIFKHWVDGISTQEAANNLYTKGLGTVFPVGFPIDMILSEVTDHYRTYGTLEKLLFAPAKIHDQWVFQMLPLVQQSIIKMYYSFDDGVMREILGKKLTARQRKDLDEISQTTGISLKSCRRQFDNLKRVCKAVEELTGSVLNNIKNIFCLPDDLAKRYCAVIFINVNRFETGKRKLHYLNFSNFYNCAHAMMSNWTYAFLDEETGGTVEIEREFLMDLRELRSLIEREKEHRALICKSLKGKISERIYNEVEHNFKVYSRTILNIAYGLNHSKELRDLFIDLVEKYIDPCKHLHWPPSEMRQFLTMYAETGLQLDFMKSQPTLRSVFKRYMEGIIGCIMPMYHN